MKIKIAIIALLLTLTVMLGGCAAPMCYPPSKVIDNKCCEDSNNNNVCDYDEEVEAPEPAPAPETVEMDEPAPEPQEEPEIQQVEIPKPEPAKATTPQYGKMKIGAGEPRQHLEILDIKAFRTSRDKGMLDEITFVVRNLGDKSITPTVDFLFDNQGMDFSEIERVYEYPLIVGKEYKLETLKPGEKHVVKQSLGIRFQGIDQKKDIELSVYDRLSSPKKELQKISKTIKPTDYFETMEIYTYSRPEE